MEGQLARRVRGRRVLGATLGIAAAVAIVARALGATGADWPMHHGDPAGSRFSTLTQITPANVSQLREAWRFDTGSGGLQVTPIVVGGVMYLGAGRAVYALDAATGAQRWKHDTPALVSRRGVAYWPGEGSHDPRILTGAGRFLVALDARSGEPVTTFGEAGQVDLKPGILGEADGNISLASPPMIAGGLIITGGNNGEGAPSRGLRGDIRAWDVVTGALRWTFHTVPRPGEPGAETWERDSSRDRSGTNVWSFFTVDEARGLVFAPIGSPTSDYYGADRPGKNLYGNSIVALDLATGRLRWYQQLVHHDLWDFDLPAAPTLIDVRRDGRTIPAVAVMTKMSTLFIFDRETGEPIFGIEERPVPKSTVPGEESWPTQPFPVKPAPLARMTFDPERDFNTLTPAIEKYCRDLWRDNRMYTEGPFTPPGTKGTMVTFPSTLGGGNWNGLAYDAGQGLVFTNVMHLGQVASMTEGQGRGGGETTWMRTTPWGGGIGRFWNPDTQIPCSAPPFGELVAVDVNKGEVAWHVPVGFVPALREQGITAETGALNIGGPIATATGLLLVGATTDRHFRAFESRSGRVLWDVELNASSHDIPITYEAGGRQFVATVAGGGSYLRSPGTGVVVAFALGGAQR